MAHGGGGPAVPHGINPADLPAIIAALRPPAEPERDIKLKIFETGEADEWLQWRARFVNIARCKGWNDAQQRRALAQSMSGKAIEATQHVRLEADGALPALTAEEALNAYEAKFITTAGTKRARSEFLSAVQGKAETTPQWHTRISTLYRRAHPAADVETSHELIERFCLGMWNAVVTERTLTDNPGTMTQALNDASRHIATLVTMERRLDGRSRTDKGINSVQGSDQSQGGNGGNGRNNTAGRNVNAIICHHCRKPGHIRRQCFAYKKTLEQQSQQRNSSNRGRRTGPQSGRPSRATASGAPSGPGSVPPPSLNALAAYIDAALENAEKEGGGPVADKEGAGNA